jgi:hypothetical protein
MKVKKEKLDSLLSKPIKVKPEPRKKNKDEGERGLKLR